MKAVFNIVLVGTLLGVIYSENRPGTFRHGDFFPRKSENEARKSEVKSSGAIRDVIKRNSPRFRKVLVRNSNSKIQFANEDAHYMTSRGKSKLDILASLVSSRMGQTLRVEKSWTDIVEKADLLSLHYEGRAFAVRLTNGNQGQLSQLAHLALDAGFAWIHYDRADRIHISVIPDVCQTKVDLAVVIDTSGSVGYRNFQLMQKFLKTLVDFFNVGQDQTHIAIVSYSSYVKVEFKLTDYNTKDELKRAIDRLQYQGQGTRTGDALMKLVNTIFQTQNGMRDDAAIPKIGIVFTDGFSQRGVSVKQAAAAVKAKGVNMFAVGITGNPRQSEMKAIASQPFEEHYIPIGSFTDLSGFVDQISTVSCDEGAQISTCENAATSVDGGSFKYFRVPLESSVRRVSVELIDRKGRSYLYTSLTLKNPGPLSEPKDVQKDESASSPRTISVSLPSGKTNILFIAIQGQEEQNEFSVSVWDSLFENDRVTTTVKENQNPLYVFTAQTKTGRSRFEYSIKDGNAANHFTIDKNSGVVRTTRQLDREAVGKYQLSIVAQDKYEICHKGLMVLVVDVLDENDNGPTFGRQYSASVREDAPSNQYVIQVKATDKDIGTNAELMYEISGPPAYKNVFKIESATGVVRTSQTLDFETKSRYDLTLSVRDKGQPSSKPGTTTLRISVVDVNEPPIFIGPSCITSQGCQFQVEEEKQLGTAVGQTITARDPDTKQGCTLNYRIVSLDSQYFDIGRTSGVISIKSRLDREVKEYYSLDVEVSDCGTPKLSQRTTVQVRATDINDNRPIFPYTSVQATVPENTRINVYTFRATDKDAGNNAVIRYRISNDNGNKQFSINQNTGVLSVSQPLDREAKSSMKLEIVASDLGNSPLSSTPVVIQITVADLNDNDPTFSGSVQQQVEENVRRGTFVLKVAVTDRDAGLNSKIKYTIVAGNTGGMFYIDQNTGDVRTNRIPDRESIASYTLKVRAQDYGSPSRASQRDYTVKIIDKNDNSPVFSNNRYTVKIKENTPISSQIVVVKASDRDEGVNAQVVFSLVTGHDDVFNIDVNTGSITLVKNLDFGKKPYFEITVRATDKGSPSLSGTAIVAVFVEDTNDHDPKFTSASYTVDLDENVKLHHTVIDVKATDQDSGTSGEVVYTITSQSAENAFYINAITGTLKTRIPIDYERTKKYELQVTASDKGSPRKQSSTKVIVNVKDLNDNVPMFPEQTISIAEDFQVNSQQVIKLVAQDRDSGSNAEVTFRLESNNVPFSVASDGTIKTTAKLDRETTDSYRIQVKVTDKGTNPSPLSSDGFVNIKITDVNDNTPAFGQNTYSCKIRENSPSDTHVCYVKATDIDLGENARISYILTASSAEFTIAETTGEIRSKITLDRETKSSFEIEIKAEDHGATKLSSTVKVTITVEDVNDNKPVFTSAPYTYNFNEEQSANTEVGRFLATDADIGSNSEVTYTIISGHIVNGQRRFIVSKDSITKDAVLKASRLDREEKSKYVLTVAASDNGNPRLSSETTVTVNVADINDNSPDFKQATYRANIKESVGLNTYVIKVEATDNDIGTNSEIVYTFKSGTNQDHFKLDSSTGEIRTAKPLDYESIQKYDFTIQAADKGQPASTPDTVQVIIDVENVDDNAPEFDKISTIQLPENTAKNYAFTRLKATDKDNNVLTFKIEDGNNEDKFELYEEGTGTNKRVLLRIKNELDRETTDKYNLTVSASDSANKVVVHVPIEVTDINDNNPVFKQQSYALSVPEDNTPIAFANSALLTIQATDKDLGKNAEIEFSISKGNTGNKFSIDTNTGALTANDKLDRETVPAYNLEVVARDKGTPSLASSVSVTITVTDINDNTPAFEKSSYAVRIPENTNRNTKVLDIRASDADIGDNGRVSYRITKGDNTVFNINTNTGELSTLVNLDRETTPSYQLTVEAYDHGTPSLSKEVTIAVTILDINDNYPIIDPSSTINNVNESASVGVEIGNIKATDKDEGSNAELVYSIREENNEGFFRIDAASGKVFLDKKLDREAKDTHKVTVVVEDKGSPVLRTEEKFDIQVLDNNDEKPMFEKTSYSVEVEENKIENNLLLLNATDKDIGINAVITYSILDDKNGVFGINAKTGLIFMKKAVDYEVNPSFELTAQAADWKFKTTVQVTVNVININDNYPVFTQKDYTKSIPENAAIKSTVITVTATDADPFGDLTYSITSNIADLPFDINSNTGVITVIGKLDRETTDSYKFEVNATDNGDPKFSSRTNVVITIIDVNDNAPTFPVYTLTTNLTENNEIGEQVAVFKATDRDLGKNAEIRYRVSPGTTDSDFEIGSVDGVIKAKRSFDRESKTVVSFTFQAYDLGSPELSSKVVVLTVTILDENDNQPIWKENSLIVSISENTPTGTQVKVVVATDADALENGRISYYILNAEQSPLSINVDSGVISVSKLMDRETKDKYEITLNASDNGYPRLSSTIKLTIIVTDVNDNTPEIGQPRVGQVFENELSGTLVMTLSATDRDLGLNAETELILLNYLDLFKLDPNSGSLTTKKPLDREQQDRYTLEIRVYDKGTPRLHRDENITVIIKDVDDNCPVFQSPQYKATISENSTFGTVVLTVKATDMDIGSNAELDYGILDSNDRGAFDVDGDTGVVIVKEPHELDVEYTNLYWLKIRAGQRDCGLTVNDSNIGEGGNPAARNYTYTTVFITLTDVNDNSPVFVNGKEKIVYNDINMTTLIQLNATDADSGAGGEVSYRLVKTEDSFQGSNIEHHITVQAYDNGIGNLATDHVLVVVNQIKCDALQFSIGETSGVVTVQSLCSVTNAKQGDVTVLIHSSIKLTCEATSNLPDVRFRWLKAGVVVSDWGVNGDWMMNDILHEHKGSYACVASNDAGVIQSNPTNVIVHEKPSIISQLEAVTVSNGEPFTLSLSAKGVPDVTYQWYKNGVIFSGATAKDFHFEEAILEDSAEYFCNISNAAGWVKSNTVAVGVFDKETVVSIKVSINNPNLDKTCHYLFPEDFEKAVTEIVAKKVVVTKVDGGESSNNNTKLCKITACSKNPCLNNGECNEDEDGEYKCFCKPAWSGRHCENDVDECLLAGSSLCYGNGVCSNTNGSFVCKCPDHLTGRRCEYKKNTCQSSPCAAQETCVPKEGGERVCVDKSSEITLVLDIESLAGGSSEKEMIYQLEDLLNQLLSAQQTTTTTKRRRRRNIVRSLDFGDCTAHIISVNGTKSVKVAFDCSAQSNTSALNKHPKFVESLCKLLLKSSTNAVALEKCGQPDKMQETEKMKPVTTTVNVVIKETDGKALGAKEAEDLLTEKKLSEKFPDNLGNILDYDLFAKPVEKEEASSSITAIIIGVLCAVIVIAVIASLLVYKKRHGYKNVKQSLVMQNRSANMIHDTSTTELVSADIGGSKNPAFNEDEVNTDATFMFEMPSGLKSSSEKVDPRGLGWYHGDMSKMKVNDLLAQCSEAGTYLLYKNGDGNLSFAVKAPEGGPGVRHILTRLEDGQYLVGIGLSNEKKFSSLEMIADFYTTHPITFKEEEPEVVFKEPLLKSAL